MVHREGLNERSVVYSVGVGKDISFDLGLVHRFGCRVVAMDPTPMSRDWIGRQDLPESMHFEPIALSNIDGPLRLYSPVQEGFVSFSNVRRNSRQDEIEVPSLRLRTIMEKFGHAHVDILKMDIEGSEYGVIEDLENHPHLPTQLLVEFHHRVNGTGLEKTSEAVHRLENLGYELFFINDLGDEFSFIRKHGHASA